MTLADQFLAEYAKFNGSDAEHARTLLSALCGKYNLYTKSPLLSDGAHIGVRYIFNDKSFCDFYLEAPTKAFTGVGSPALEGAH